MAEFVVIGDELYFDGQLFGALNPKFFVARAEFERLLNEDINLRTREELEQEIRELENDLTNHRDEVGDLEARIADFEAEAVARSKIITDIKSYLDVMHNNLTRLL